MNKEIMIDVITKLPDDVTIEDIIETLKLIKETMNRIDDFDESTALSTEELKRMIKRW